MFIVSPPEPSGLVTFTRQSLNSFPKWERYFLNINTNVASGVGKCKMNVLTYEAKMLI